MDQELFSDWYGAKVEHLSLSDEDVVVILVPGPISDKTADSIHAKVKPMVPNNKVLILSDNIKIASMGKRYLTNAEIMVRAAAISLVIFIIGMMLLGLHEQSLNHL